MKRIFYWMAVLAILISCKDKPSETPLETAPSLEEAVETVIGNYPENMSKILDAHGGLSLWDTMETLEFSVEKPGGYEITTTDLKDRFTLIELPKSTIGFDGEVLWEKHKTGTDFNKDPKLYYNKMFNLYAIPFVLAHDNLSYSEASPLQFEGKTYPGIAISVEANPTTFPFKAYVLYYDKVSYQVVGLAYTESDGKGGEERRFVNYKQWQAVEDLLLPETMVWYQVEDGHPTQLDHEIKFVSPMLTTVKMDLRVYWRPEGGELVQ